MPTPHDDPKLLEEWNQIEAKLLKDEELPRYKVHEKIADKYNVSRTTVYYWLTPSYREYQSKLVSPVDLNSRPGRYQREPNRREYDKSYKWFTRHLSQYIPQAFDGYKTLSLKELSDELAQVAESDPKVGRPIHLQENTLEKHIREIDDVLSLTEVESGIYRWENDGEI